jgi:hypothetical protein
MRCIEALRISIPTIRQDGMILTNRGTHLTEEVTTATEKKKNPSSYLIARILTRDSWGVNTYFRQACLPVLPTHVQPIGQTMGLLRGASGANRSANGVGFGRRTSKARVVEGRLPHFFSIPHTQFSKYLRQSSRAIFNPGTLSH